MRTLRVGEDLSLPLDTVTDTIGVLAIKGAGKTHTTMVLTEEMAKHGIPVVVFDVVGVCWGLRLAADGKDAGLPFIIFGGPHGDVPLASSAGKVIADFVVAERSLVVLDLSGFETKAEQNRFIKEFCVRIYQTNRDPIHLIMDEADDYLPQKPMGDDAFTLRAVEVLVRRGRARGIGVTLVTQRSAAINKGVLTQVSSLILGRTISPQDRAAVKLWVDAHGTEGEKSDFWASIVALPTKEKWVWAPMRDVFARTKIRARETYDSSFTPKVGDKRMEPKKLGPVDLEAIRTRIAATIEQIKADDPKELRATIKKLEAALKSGGVTNVTNVVETKTVDVPILTQQQAAALADCVVEVGKVAATLRRMADEVTEGLKSVALAGTRRAQPLAKVPSMFAPRPVPKTNGHAKVPVFDDGWKPGKCERALLTVLAQRNGDSTSQKQLAVLAMYSGSSSTFTNALGALRSHGLALGGREDIRITAEGIEAIPPAPPMPSGHELVTVWLGKLGKAEAALLSTIYDAHPKELSKDELADRAQYTTTSSTFTNALGALRSLALVTKGTTRLGSALAGAAS